MKTINFITQVFAKKTLWLLISVFLFSLELMAQPGTATYINTNVAAAGSNAFPFGSTTTNVKIQWIYAAGTFSTLGGGTGTPAPGGMAISKVYIQFATANPAIVYPNLTISLGQNVGTQSNWGTVSNTTYPFTTGLTTCFFQASGFQFTGNAVNAWYGITLQTPFPYDPSLSLVVEAKSSIASGGGNNVRTQTAVTGQMQRVYGPFANTTGTSNTLLTPFGFDLIATGGCANPPTAGTTTVTPSTVCAGASVALNLTGNTVGTGQTYQWQRDIGGGYVNIGGVLSNPTFNDIPPSNASYRCIVTCGASANSTATSVTVSPGLAGGTYTINSSGGGDFISFGAAVAAMSCGIADDVIFNVAPGSGPYTEQVTIPVILNAAADKTITFNCNGRTLQHTPVTASRHVLKLDGADFVTIDSLNIVGLATDFGWGVHLMNSANNNTISNCTINMNAVTSITASASGGIIASNSTTSAITAGNNASNLTITGCTITGGYHGINLNGLATGLNAVNNVITDNVIQDTHGNGIELVHNDGALVQGNDISRPTKTTMLSAGAGIEIGTGNRNLVINANRIHDTHNLVITQSGTAYGIFFSSCDAPVGMENSVTNNLIYNFNSLTGIQYGLYNVGSDGVRYYHNTVVFDNAASTSGTTYAFHQTTLASNIEFKNNILYVTRGGTGTKNCLRFATATSTIVSNNNALYINAPAGTNGIGFFNAINSVTLNDWLVNNANLFDAASVSTDPSFFNPSFGNYQPTSIALDNIGIGVGVATDILGGARNAVTPDPGAYEYTIPPIDAGVTAFVDPGTSGCYTNSEIVTVTIKNHGSTLLNFSTTSLTVNCNVSGAATTSLSAMPSGTLAVGATMNVALSPALDMTANGVYTFNTSTSIAGDGNSGNNALPAVSRTAGITAGIVSASVNPICISGATVLNLSGSSGGSIQWQENAGSWNNVGAGGTSYSPGTITQTTIYRAVVSCNTNTALSNELTVAVNNPSITNAFPATRCGIGSVTLGASIAGGATTVNWYAAPSGGIALANTTSFVTPEISSSTTYYAAATAGSSAVGTTPLAAEGSQFSGTVRGYSFTSPISFTITGVRVPSVATANTSQSIAILRFNPPVQPPAFSASTNAFTTLFLTQGNPATGVIPCNVQVNVGDVIGVLGQGGSTGILTSYSTPAGPYVTTIAGQPVTLTRMLMQFQLLTTAPQNISTEATGAVGRVELTYLLGCEGPRVPIEATVTEAPGIDVQATASAICPGQSVDVSVNSPSNDPNYTYSWTSVPAGFTASGPGPHSVSPSVSTMYIVNAVDNTAGANAGCTNTGSVNVLAGASGGTVVSNQTEICVSGTPVLTVAGAAGGPIQWQESTTGLAGSWSNVGSGTVSYTPLSPITQTMYYQVVVSCGVFPVYSNMVTVTVNNPAIVSSTSGIRCGIGTVGISASVVLGNTINWYSVPTGGSPLPGGSGLASGATFTTPSISSTTNFYAEAVTSGGTGGTKIAISEVDIGASDRLEIMNVSPVPVDVTGWRLAASDNYTNINAVNVNVQTLSGVMAPGQIMTWTENGTFGTPGQWGNNLFWNPGAFPSFTGWLMILDNFNNIVDFVIWNWPAANIAAMNPIVAGIPITIGSQWNGNGFNATTVPATQSLSRIGNSDNNSAADISVLNLSIGALNSGMTIPFTGFGCAGSARQVVTATVTTPPAILVTSSNDLACPGSSATVSVSSPSNDPNYTYSWTSSPAGFIASGPGPHAVTPLVTTTYTVTALDNTAGPNAGCVNSGSVTVVSANSYCAAVNNTGACITNVTLNTLNNSTGCQAAAPYYSFQSATTTLNAEFTYALSVTVNSDIYGLGIVSVWFDWNKDGVFSPSEWYQPYTAALSGSINVTVPVGVLGNVVMRVRSRGASNVNGSGDACTTMGSGETEDYCINIIPAPPIPPTCVVNVSPVNASTIICPAGTTTLTWGTGVGGGLPSGYNVYFGSSPAPPAVGSNPQTSTSYFVGSLAPGTYYWRVEPFNGYGTESSCAVNSFTVPVTAVGTITQSAPAGCGASSLVTVDITGGWTGALSLEYEAPAGSNNWLSVAGVTTLPVVINVPLPAGDVFTWGFRAAITDCQNNKIYSNYLTYISSNPLVPTGVLGVERCGPGNIAVSATVNPGHIVDWFDAATGGNLLGSGSPFVYSASATTIIYAASRHIASGCLGVRTPQNILVRPLPTTTVANSGPHCAPAAAGATATATFTATGGGALGNVDAEILSPLAPSNGSSAVGFEVENTSTSPIIIHYLSFASSAALGTNQLESVYYKVSPINCIAQGNITTNATWTLIGSATAVSAGPYPALTQIPLDVNITIPAGQTYAFALGGNGVRYEGTGTTCITTPIVSDAYMSVKPGFGGTLASPILHRRFSGKVTYSYLVGTGVNFTWGPSINCTLPDCSQGTANLQGNATPYLYTVTVTDIYGCSSTSTTSVVINKVPSINTITSATLNGGAATPFIPLPVIPVFTEATSCDKVVNYSLNITGFPAPAEVVGGLGYTFSGSTIGSGSGTGSGSTFTRLLFNGNTTAIVTASNVCGSQSRQFRVTVTDNVAPIITPLEVPTTNTNAGSCASLVVVTPPDACNLGVSDNCMTVFGTGPCSANVIVAWVSRSDGRAQNDLYYEGTTVVTWAATDAVGNTSTATQNVVVVNIKPVVTSFTASNDFIYVNGKTKFTATFTDEAGGGPYTVKFYRDKGDASPANIQSYAGSGTTINTVSSDSIQYSVSEVAEPKVEVIDGCNLAADQVPGVTTIMYLPVAVAGSQFTTGGGNFTIPAGASAYEGLQANVGDIVKKATTGNSFKGQFQMNIHIPNAADWSVHTDNGNNVDITWDYLTISGCSLATFKGATRINGVTGYKVFVQQTDKTRNPATSNLIRVKVTRTSDNAVMFDTQPGLTEALTATNGGGSAIVGVLDGGTIKVQPSSSTSCAQRADGTEILGNELLQNVPNPFSGTTEIGFTVPEDGHYTLKVYNYLGEEVSTLFNEDAISGVNYHVTFDGSKMVSGIYMYTLTGENVTETRRMNLIKQ